MVITYCSTIFGPGYSFPKKNYIVTNQYSTILKSSFRRKHYLYVLPNKLIHINFLTDLENENLFQNFRLKRLI